MENKIKNIPDIENRFTYHKPTDAQQCIYPVIRTYAKELAYKIAENVPEGREKSLALTKLEEVVMWANAGISREEKKEETSKEEKPTTIIVEAMDKMDIENIIRKQLGEGYRITNTRYDAITQKTTLYFELLKDGGGGMSAR